MTTAHLVSVSLSDRLVEIIGPKVVAGSFDGTTVAALSAQFHVSRTVVREALERLADKGLVTTRINAGTRPAPAADWDLLDADVLRWLACADPGLAGEAQAVLDALAGTGGRIADALLRRLRGAAETDEP